MFDGLYEFCQLSTGGSIGITHPAVWLSALEFSMGEVMGILTRFPTDVGRNSSRIIAGVHGWVYSTRDYHNNGKSTSVAKGLLYFVGRWKDRGSNPVLAVCLERYVIGFISSTDMAQYSLFTEKCC